MARSAPEPRSTASLSEFLMSRDLRSDCGDVNGRRWRDRGRNRKEATRDRDRQGIVPRGRRNSADRGRVREVGDPKTAKAIEPSRRRGRPSSSSRPISNSPRRPEPASAPFNFAEQAEKQGRFSTSAPAPLVDDERFMNLCDRVIVKGEEYRARGGAGQKAPGVERSDRRRRFDPVAARNIRDAVATRPRRLAGASRTSRAARDDVARTSGSRTGRASGRRARSGSILWVAPDGCRAADTATSGSHRRQHQGLSKIPRSRDRQPTIGSSRSGRSTRIR